MTTLKRPDIKEFVGAPVEISVDIQIKTDRLEQLLKEIKELCEKFAVKDDGKADYCFHWETI